MTKTAVGLAETRETAQRIIDDLLQNGFPRENISFISRDEHGQYAAEHQTLGGAEKGAKKGAAIGGAGGFLVGLVGLAGLAVTGLGAVLVAGPIVGALAGTAVGAFAGGLIGALTHAGLPEADARHFTEGVHAGGILITVDSDAAGSSKATEIMIRHGAITEWHEDGTPRRRTALRDTGHAPLQDDERPNR
jgi:hypothetical protein